MGKAQIAGSFLLFGLLGIFTGCEKGCMDSNSFNYNADATVDDGSCVEMYGCLGFSSGYSNSGAIGVSLNNAYYDQKMNEEVLLQRNFFNGIPAAVYILYEPSESNKNAYANQDGQILFGYYMFYYTISNFNELAAAGILAHEWGHRVQFTYGWNASVHNPHLELEADAFSGFYMALGKAWAWSQIQGYYASTYATGDYNFNHPSHHGTPDQRLAAAYLGVQTAVDAVNTGTQYTYEELHQVFMNAINNDIVQRRAAPKGKQNASVKKIASGLSKGDDIKISEGVSLQERQKLFPKK